MFLRRRLTVTSLPLYGTRREVFTSLSDFSAYDKIAPGWKSARTTTRMEGFHHMIKEFLQGCGSAF